jgi:iron(III) transport system permease protein
LLAGWIGWAWVGLAVGVPMVAMATASALSRVDPAWEDAARLSGAGRRAIWRQFVWPIARPDAARAAGLVFALTLIEPGAPLVLGLRRTLAFQIVEAALGPEPAPRAALLALASLLIAVVGRVLVRWWGGTPLPVTADQDRIAASPVAAGHSSVARWPRASWYVASLSTGVVLVWLPILALVATAMAAGPSLAGNGAAASGMRRMLNAESQRLLLNSLALGLAVTLIDLALAWTLAAWAGRRHPWVLALAGWPELFPPMALGVGALVLPEVLQLVADWARAGGMRPSEAMARGASLLAGCLDPDRTAGVALVLALSAVRLPFLARAVEHGWSRFRPTLIDAALSLGATPRQARRTATGRRLGAAPAALLWTFALAATSLAPALVLAPTIEGRPLAPGVLILADAPGGALPRAAMLAAIAIALNLSAMAIAATSRSVRLGDWFRA